MSDASNTAVASTAREKYCILVPHPREGTVLVVRQGNGWTLPEFLPDRDIHNLDLSHARRTVLTQLGLNLTLTYALRLFEVAIPGALNIFVGEQTPGDWLTPPAGAWVGLEALGDLQMLLPQQRRVLQAWFDVAAGRPVPALGLNYWKPGWLRAVEGWLSVEVERLGYVAIAPLELQRSSYTSASVRVPALPADLYLKVMAPPLAHEAALLPVLAEKAPEHFPIILARDVEAGWALMRDIGGRPLGSDVPADRWEEIARAYGQLQVASVPLADRWLALGCRDLSPGRLEEEIDFLFSQAPALLRGLNDQLSGEDLAALRGRAGEFKKIATELAGYGLPLSLDHGDFHAGNVRVTDDGCIFYDWSHACVTFPFPGFGDLLYDDDWFPSQPAFNDRIRDAYLESWSAYAPMTRLRDAFRLSQLLRKLSGAIHQGRLISAFWQMLGGQDYIPETPTGNAFQHLQWWLDQKLRMLAHGLNWEEYT